MAEKRGEREQAVARVIEPIREALLAEGVDAEIVGRPKHFDSIHRKMQFKERAFDAIQDLLGVRIITETKTDCYRVLGVIHDRFTPVPDHFKDYIATPKGNGYQSLHTTVIGPDGRFVEVQIRTRDMHRVAEYGVAAHYTYKEGGRPDRELDEKLGGIVGGTEEWEDGETPQEYIDFLKTSLYQDEVFVFTPRGELRHLPKGATALDFAFLIHTGVGLKAVGARANGRLVPLRYEMKNGDTLEIVTQPSAHPSEDWLTILRTSRAKQKVRHWLKEQRREDSVGLGREILARELKRLRKDRGAGQGAGQHRAGDGARIRRGSAGRARAGRHVGDPGGAAPAPGDRGGAGEAQAQEPVRATARAVGKEQRGDPRSRGGQPHGAPRQVLPAGAGRADRGHDHARAGDERAPGRLPQRHGRPHRAGASRRSLLGRGGPARVRGEAPRLRRRPPRRSRRLANAISATGTNTRNASMHAVDGDARGVFLIEVNNLNHLQRVISTMKRVKGVRAVERTQFTGEDE